MQQKFRCHRLIYADIFKREDYGTYTYEGVSGEIDSFDHYVQRKLAISEGIDPSKVTTGVVVQSDGTVRHVPTKIIQNEGESYAVISSLRNSTYSLVINSSQFKDVGTHWAKEMFHDMGSRMVIGGVGNGLFEPNRDMARAEFAAIVVKAMGLKTGISSHPFVDVKSTDWYFDSVKAAYEYGIITGYENGSFRPMDSMTREQAMTMVARAMKITGLDAKLPENEREQWLARYTDTDRISDYARARIAECLKIGIMTGRDASTIAPKDNISRAEVAVIIQRLLQKSGLI